MDEMKNVYTFEIRCHCKRTMMAWSKRSRTYYCKNCSFPIEFTSAEQSSLMKVTAFFGGQSTKDSIIRKQAEYIEKLENDCKKIQQCADKNLGLHLEMCSSYEKMERECKELKESIEKLEQMKSEAVEAAEKTFLEKSEKLEQAYSEREKKLNESHNADIEKWGELYSEQKSKVRSLTGELSDAESKSAYLESENRRLQKIDTREIVNLFLEFMSGIYNASLDSKDMDSLSAMIQARTEKVVLMAQSHGVEVLRSDRGETLRDGRVDIDTRSTDDPALDGKVIKSRQFGCRFRDDAEVEIPEKVAIWSYSKPVEEPVAPVVEETVSGSAETPAEAVAPPEDHEVPQGDSVTQDGDDQSGSVPGLIPVETGEIVNTLNSQKTQEENNIVKEE